jgi:hypothetical protein
METSSKASDSSKGGPSTLDSAECEPGKPVPSIRERAALLNQKESGLTIRSASAAAVNDGFSPSAVTGQAKSNRREGAS